MRAPSDDRDHARAAAAAEHEELRARLEEAEQTLRALRNGEVDAIIVGEAVYTLAAADAAEQRFRGDVLAQIEDAVAATDNDGRLIYLNAAAERLYRQPASQVLGRPIEHLYVDQRGPGQAEDIAQALRARGTWRGQSVHLRPDGSRFDVESTVSRLHDARGESAGLLAVVRDVSERVRAEQALRESQARRQFALESARVGEWDLDLAADEMRRSPQHDQCFGYREPVERWGLRTFLAHVHPDDRAEVQGWMERALREPGDMDFECRVVWPDGSLHWLEVHGTVFVEGGRPVRMLGIVSDISERKLAEQALLDADRRKDEFLATLAHELRNPLAPIRNSLKIMRLSQDRQAHDHAQEVIERQLVQMVHLVDDLLDVSRISQGKVDLRRELIDVAAVMRNAVDTSRPAIEKASHQLVVELPARPLTVNADMTRLTQVLANLLNNAAKFTPAGGRLELRAAADGAQAVITVKDSGIGIPAEMLPRVFDMFAQIKRPLHGAQGGLGIGLALVKQLVEMHGGAVAARSEGPGRGTEFEVRLPRVQAAASQDEPAQLPAAAAAVEQPRRILVVDDNRDSADSMSAMLELIGCQTACAYDGVQAIEVAEAFRPEIMLLDIGMPGLNGYEVARRIRAREWGRTILLVALTGWGQDDDRRQSREAGFDHHLTKPVEFGCLEALLNLQGR